VTPRGGSIFCWVATMARNFCEKRVFVGLRMCVIVAKWYRCTSE